MSNQKHRIVLERDSDYEYEYIPKVKTLKTTTRPKEVSTLGYITQAYGAAKGLSGLYRHRGEGAMLLGPGSSLRATSRLIPSISAQTARVINPVSRAIVRTVPKAKQSVLVLRPQPQQWIQKQGFRFRVEPLK